jgi:hypothetical protein
MLPAGGPGDARRSQRDPDGIDRAIMTFKRGHWPRRTARISASFGGLGKPVPASAGNPGGHRAEGPGTHASKDRDISARQLTLVL